MKFVNTMFFTMGFCLRTKYLMQLFFISGGDIEEKHPQT